MLAFVEQHEDRFGVEPLCTQLPFSSSSYYAYKARQANPQLQPARWLRDEQLKPEIQRVFKENFCVYGAHKLWKQRKREGETVAAVHSHAADEEPGHSRRRAWQTLENHHRG
jgi:hypothetical protein